jgi:hypothetical protein
VFAESDWGGGGRSLVGGVFAESVSHKCRCGEGVTLAAGRAGGGGVRPEEEEVNAGGGEAR